MEERLKERVVGAAVLAALAVIFVPMLLEPQEEVSSEAVHEGEAEPSANAERERFSSRVKPLASPQTQAASAENDGDQMAKVIASARKVKVVPGTDAIALEHAESKPPIQPKAPAKVSSMPTKPPVASAKVKPVGGSKPTLPSKSELRQAAAGDWVVQLASFSKSGNAAGLRDRLKGLGYQAFVVKVGTDAGTVSRVYVGPAKDKAAARKLIEPLRRAVELKGLAVRLPAG